VNAEALMMIVGVSIGMAVVSSLPFGGLTIVLIIMALYGAMLNYSFMAMTTTADGDFDPPSALDALSGGLGLSFKMILMIILMAVILFFTAIQLGQLAANLLGILFIVGLPAILISFAHSGSILQALNPLMFVSLMFRIGFPYLVLLGFLLVMSSSVGVISSIIGDDLAAVSAVFQSIVSNYYTVVMFHLMGYMLFQYQDRLGFSSDHDITGFDRDRSEVDSQLARVGVLLKEGEYVRSLDLLQKSSEKFPEDKRFSEKYFDLLILLKQTKRLQAFAERYFMTMVNANRLDQLCVHYRKVAAILPKYKPQSSELRYQLALSCDQQANYKAVVWMINGLHVDDLKYRNIVPAYQLLVNALTELNQTAAAQKCALLVEKLKAMAPPPAPEAQPQVEPPPPRPAGKAVFGAQELSMDAVKTSQPNISSSDIDEPVADNNGDLPPMEFKP
jgi:hypothetical protein